MINWVWCGLVGFSGSKAQLLPPPLPPPIQGSEIPSPFPVGEHWTLWSEWAGCDHIDQGEFCAHPAHYFAEAIRYRECRLQDDIHEDSWGLDDLSQVNVTQPPKGDPRDIIETFGLPPSWYDGTVERFVSAPSTRLACDPRLGMYATMDPNFADYLEVEDAIENDPFTWQERQTGILPGPYKNIIIERALCIEAIKCPLPLPWSAWNCHCQDGSASSTANDNPSNLPLCGCSTGSTRSRVQLCHDVDRSDAITCRSVGEDMTRDSPGGCVPDSTWQESWYDNTFLTKNWFAQSTWIHYGEAGYDSDLSLDYALYGGGVNLYTTASQTYINQCWEKPATGIVDGKVIKFASTYESPVANDVQTQWEYGIQSEFCAVQTAAWGAWGSWGGCSASCAGGLRSRTRDCMLNGAVRNDLLNNKRDCDCQGEVSSSTPCNTFCCPIWHTCSGNNCITDNGWSPLTLPYVFSECTGCGQLTLELERHCKCSQTANSVTTWRYGNLDQPAFSVTNVNYQHDCPMDVDEVVETSASGRKYIAKKAKVCSLPCCAGWDTWATWSRCDDTCYDSVGNANFQPADRTRRRECGCGTGDVATDFSACVPVAGGVGVQFEDASDGCPLPTPCPFWAAWGNWGACSETCRESVFNTATDQCDAVGNAIKTRTRTCNNGVVGDANCPASGEMDTDPCDPTTPFCCLYTLWMEWDACTSSTGTDCTRNGEVGRRTRTRDHECGLPEDCPDCIHSEECPLPECAGWCEWGSWSTCSSTCGTKVGSKSRTRCCNGAAINSDYCPCHGTFAIDTCAWGGNTCTDYYKSGTQLTNWNEDVTNGFHSADDEGYVQVNTCNDNRAPCPMLQMDGVDRAWGEWGACTQTCGEGREQRSRICQNGVLGVDEECSGGDLYATRTCNLGGCPYVDNWSSWTTCSASCDDGTRTRARNCIGDGVCVQTLSESAACTITPCPYLSDWSQWSICSQDCAERNGVTVRERRCINGVVGDDGCTGQTYESMLCNQLTTCPTWATWSTWTSCQEVASNTCVHSRARQCVNGIMGDLECPVDGADQDAPCSCTCPTTVNARQQSGATSENDTGNGVVQLTLNILFVFCSILLI